MPDQISLNIKLEPQLDVAKLNVLLSSLAKSMGAMGKDIKLIDAAKLDSELSKLDDSARKIGEQVDNTNKKLPIKDPIGENSFFKFNQMSQALETFSGSLDKILGPGIKFEKSLSSVSAITGLTGDKLDKLGAQARELGVQFGTSATDQLESFQGLLSKLGPDVAKDSQAMGILAENVNILSKASGGTVDAAGSMDAITTSLLQMDLAKGTPLEVAKNSTDAMNTIAAGAQVGAAEIYQVAESMKVSGSAAKGANMDLVALNAAIQTMALGGKVGSEAGMGLRNVLGLLQNAAGPAEDMMNKLGTSSKELGELLTTQGLDAAMEKLSVGMNTLSSDAERNAALMTIFGTENASAADTLMNNLDKYREFSAGIRDGMTGTGAAFDQANINMDNTATNIDKVKAYIEDTFISMQQFAGSTFSTVAGAASQISPMVVTFKAMGDAIPFAKIEQFGLSILKSLIPSIGGVATVTAAEIAATEGATAAQLKFNFAALANPYLLGAAGLVAVIAALAAFTDVFGKSTKAKLEDSQAEGELIQAQIKGNEAKQASIKKNQDLVSSYENLAGKSNKTAEDEQKLANMQYELSKTYPDAIKDVNNYAANLGGLAAAATNSEKELAKLKDELARLKEDAAKNKINTLQLQTDVNVENVADAFGEFGGMFDSLSVVGQEKAKKIFADYQTALNTAASETDITKAATTLNKQLESEFGDYWSSADKKELLNFNNMVQTSMDSAVTTLQSRAPAMQEALKAAFDSSEKLNLNQISTDYGVSLDQAKQKAIELGAEMISQGGNAQDVYTKLADATGMSVDGIKSAIAGEKERQDTLLYTEVLTAKDGKTRDEALQKMKETLRQNKEDVKALESKSFFGKSLSKEESIQLANKKASAKKLEEQLGSFALIDKFLNGEKMSRKDINTLLNTYKAQLGEVLKKQTFLDMMTGNNAQTKKALYDNIAALEKYNFTEDVTEKKTKKSTAASKSRAQINKELYDQFVKELDIKNDIAKADNQVTINKAKRERTQRDDLKDNQLDLDVLKAKADEWQRINEITVNADGTYSVKMNVSTDEKKDIIYTYKRMLVDLKKAEADYGGFQVKIEVSEEEEGKEKMKSALKSRSEAYKEHKKHIVEGEKERVAALQKIHEKEIADINRVKDMYLNMVDIAQNASVDKFSDKITKGKEAEIKKLDALKEAEIINEDEYNNRKNKIEEKAQLNITMIQETARGARLEAERALTLQLMLEQEKRIKIELAAMDKTKDPDKYEKTNKSLTDLQTQIGDKKDILLQYGSEISAGLSDAFSNIFQDDEKMKAPWKKLFAITAGALKQYASLLIAQLILGDISALAKTSFAAVVLLPMIVGLSNALIGQIIDPIIANVASFSTGGVASHPMLAVVGDAKKTGNSSNIEAILNEKLFGDLVDTILARYTAAMDRYFSAGLTINANGNVNDISQIMAQLTREISKIEPFFKDGSFTPDNILAAIEAAHAQKSLDLCYDTNQITIDSYAQKLSDLQVNMLQYMKPVPAVFNQNLSMFNDPRAAVLDSSELREAIFSSGDQVATRIEKTLWETTEEIKKELRSFSREIYVEQSSAYKALAQEHNKQTGTYKTRRFQ